MKFSDGFWLNQPGYEVHYANQAYHVDSDEHSIKIIVTDSHIFNRAQTLGGPNLEMTFSSHCENIIKVSIKHFRGGLNDTPEFDINEDCGFTPTVTITEHSCELVSGKTRVVISRDSWSVKYYYGDKLLTGNGWRGTTFVNESVERTQKRLEMDKSAPFWAYAGDPRSTFIREQLNISVGEYIYGFGEKFTAFVKNGQTVDIWNADGGTCSEQSYKSIPFYISSRSYGVFVNESDRVSFEVGSDTVSKVSFTIPGEHLEYFVIGGENLGEVLSGYTLLTGRPALPPAQTFGLWLSTSFTTTYDESTVNSFIDGMRERKIPLQMFHFDCFWMKEYHWCDFEWDKSQFPDPPAMLDRLKKKDLGICVWINPYISQHSSLFEAGRDNGYFIKNPDGSVFQCDIWQPGLAIVDFTNPDACEWFASKLRVLLEMGVDCIKTDFGERIPTNVVFHNGMNPFKMHNYYTYLYNKVVFETIESYKGKGGACLFARSATVGGQKFPVHWGGDCSAEFSSMAETLRGGLSLCSSGFGFFSHDIGGFESTATPDIYKRWCAFGLLSSHSRLHGSTSYRVPWNFDEEACDVLRFYTNLKGRLMPYLWAQAIKTSKTGIPMMRPMVIDFADDPVCLTLDRQYMLGDSLLCVPVMNEEGIAEFYLPAGKWTDIITGETYEGGRYVTRHCNYFEMPVLAREDSVIVYGNFEDNFVYDYLENAEAVAYNITEGKTVTAPIYDASGAKIADISAANNGGSVTVKSTETSAHFTISIK